MEATQTRIKDGYYRVKIRRDLDADIKPTAEQLEGEIFYFVRGWTIEDEESKIYKNEFAMLPKDFTYPTDAPIWIASGDLIPENIPFERLSKEIQAKIAGMNGQANMTAHPNSPSELKMALLLDFRPHVLESETCAVKPNFVYFRLERQVGALGRYIFDRIE